MLRTALILLACCRWCTAQADEGCQELASVVRIRTELDDGVVFGTGTIVGKTESFAYVLTADHVLRDGVLPTIEFFPYEPPSTRKQVTILARDRVSDLALLRVLATTVPGTRRLGIQTPKKVAGLKVTTVGCSRGAKPTTQHTWIEELAPVKLKTGEVSDRWITGSEPKPGRSGGPMIHGRRVVGVCSAGGHGKGQYTSLALIHDLCATAKADWLYQGVPVPHEPLPQVSISGTIKQLGTANWVDITNRRCRAEFELAVHLKSGVIHRLPAMKATCKRR